MGRVVKVRLLPLVLVLGLLTGCGMGLEGVVIDRAMLEYTIGLDDEIVEIKRGGEVAVTVKVSYVIPLYARPVTVKLIDPPDGVTAKDVEIFADKGVLRLKAAKNAALTGDTPVEVTVGASNGQVAKTGKFSLKVVANK
ncbi:hypothetical protein BH24DEI1_BH24DEI1_15700 [soil metagenome]